MSSGPSGSRPLVNPFADKEFRSKLENDSRTEDYLKDPEFMDMIEKITKDPRQLGKHMQDVRIMTALGVLLGVDLNMGDEGEDETNGWPTENGGTSTPPPETKPMKSGNTSPSQKPEGPATNLNDSQKEALKEKESGNAAYKKKDFETALGHYAKAIELDPTNIIYRNNRAAVYFEQGMYDDCIKECEQAVEIGRENRVDDKLLEKALARKESAYQKSKGNSAKVSNMATAQVDDEFHEFSELSISDSGSKQPISWQDKLQEAKMYKQSGNEMHKASKPRAAISKYHRALLYLKAITQSQEKMPFMPDQDIPKIPESVLKEISQINAQCYNNLAACLLQSESPMYSKVVQYCDEVLNDSPHNAKALYRKGCALYHLKSPEDAILCLQKAKSQPGGQKDTNIRKYIELCERSLTEQERSMKDTYKNMFSS